MPISMPTVFNYKGYKFYFWANENNEPIHIHVSQGNPGSNSTKFWILKNDRAELAFSNGEFGSKELKDIAKYVENNISLIKEAWFTFHRYIKYID